jgi:hypothetical protein
VPVVSDNLMLITLSHNTYMKIFSDVAYSFFSIFLPVKQSVTNNIPYYSQWESPELVDSILARRFPARADPQWTNSGATSPEDYEYWSWNICGMACLKMVLGDIFHKRYRTIDLAKEAAKYGAYIPMEKEIQGLLYAPFCKFVAQVFGLRCSYYGFMTQKVIKYELSRGNYVIASVNPKIRDQGIGKVKNKSGHLVLISGYDERLKQFHIHNPSGYFQKSQSHYWLSYVDFANFFGHKGLVIK